MFSPILLLTEHTGDQIFMILRLRGDHWNGHIYGDAQTSGSGQRGWIINIGVDPMGARVRPPVCMKRGGEVSSPPLKCEHSKTNLPKIPIYPHEVDAPVPQ